MNQPKFPWRRFLAATGLVALATGVGTLGRDHLAAPDVVMLYLLAIGTTAAAFGRGASLLASALSVIAYDFFFVAPFFRLQVADERNLLTFAMMFLVGLLTNGLMLRIRREALRARSREARTAALYDLARDLGAAIDEEQAASAAARHANRISGEAAAVLLADPDGVLRARAQAGALAESEAAGQASVPAAPDLDAARWALDHGKPAGRGTEVMPGAPRAFIPLTSGVETLGVLALSPRDPAHLAEDQRDFWQAFARQTALAVARARFADRAKTAALRARTEEMRSSLLSAVSHDLRTPLAAITGAATALQAAGDRQAGERDRQAGESDTDARADLLDTICEEAERLERLVRNLLDMTQVQAGTIEVKREWVPLEEIVGSGLERVERQLAGRPVHTVLAEDLPLVSVDPVLLQQVFVNVLENAAKYAPGTTPIEISAVARGGDVVIELSDRGPGFGPGAAARVFEKFFREGRPGVTGSGLGLAICRGIIEAHGGTIEAENREGGGACFRIVLPFAGTPPPVPMEADR